MNLLKDFDQSYRDSIRTTYTELEKTYNLIATSYQFDLTKTEITEPFLKD